MTGAAAEGSFTLHPRLEQDCHRLGSLASGLLLLNRNATLHWFLIVPLLDATDLLDLASAEREALFEDATCLHRYLRDGLGYPRVNVGALGLVVPQLHLHVVGRREDDPCWPAPVWGCLKAGPAYTDQEVAALRRELVRRSILPENC